MLTNNGLLQTLGLLALVSTLSGCAMESADGQLGDEEATEQTAEALGVWGTASWGSGNGPNPLDLGSDSNRTCFLTGIRGQLYADDDTRWRDLPFVNSGYHRIPPEPFRWIGYQLFTRLTGKSPRL